jgi:hypothetical protein
VLAEAGVKRPAQSPACGPGGQQDLARQSGLKARRNGGAHLWGELAYQLDGRTAYERIRADDERGTSPGDALSQLFKDYGPCLILIDEWVAYARQLHDASRSSSGKF